MKTISFVTLGCRANQAENTEYHQGMLEAGWEILEPDNNSSSVYVVNTCTVTNEAERQSRQMIRRLAKNNPLAKIVVTGCSSKYIEESKNLSNEVSLFVPNMDKHNFMQRLYNHLGIEKDFNPIDTIPTIEDSDTTRLNLKISDGCNWACSFCIIPRTRGKLRSLSEDEIIAKAQRAEQMGFKELVLTAIQLGGYGKDKGKNGLEILIPRLLAETTIPRIRLSSIEPTDVSDQLIEELSKSDRICNQFHIPVQSGSDNILDLMKRRYTRAEYKDRIDTLRKYIPNVTLTTDILVGFPSETDQDFADSCEFVQTIGFDKLHIFPYSDRTGTAASKMAEKIKPEIMKIRKKELAEIDRKMNTKWLEKGVGQIKQVLIENTKESDNLIHGTSKDYYKVIIKDSVHRKNDLINVEIESVDYERQSLIGRYINNV